MRYAVLSDVHANLHALSACLADARRAGVDAVVCAGDLVGYGALPNECVDVLRAACATCVAGNHDLIAVGRLSDERSSASARESLRWTREVLRADTRSYLAGLPTCRALPGLVLTHGSLDDVEEYVRSPERARALLGRLSRSGTDAELLLVGHTHQPWAFGLRRGSVLTHGTGVRQWAPGEAHLLNPGSVGQSRDVSPAARYLLLDMQTRTASFRAVHYDLRGCRRALRQAGLPGDSCHAPPNLGDRARRLVARAPAPVAAGLRSGVRLARRWSGS